MGGIMLRVSVCAYRSSVSVDEDGGDATKTGKRRWVRPKERNKKETQTNTLVAHLTDIYTHTHIKLHAVERARARTSLKRYYKQVI